MSELVPAQRPHVIDDLPRLAAASVGLMLAPLASAYTEALKLGADVDSYLVRAAAVSVSRERAIETLREVQGRRAGSTPTADDFRAALNRLYTMGR